MRTVWIWAILFLCFQGCNLNGPIDQPDIEVTEKSARLIEANNQFGLDLFRHVYAYEKESGNIMLSPMSVALALAMTYNGAETTTRDAMEKTLRLDGLSPEDINLSYQSLVKAMQGLDPKVSLDIANAIFYRQGFEVEPEFVRKNRTYYNAEISSLDFASPGALQVINGWVNTNTKGKIPSILDQITPLHVMFLLNAIYFKGAWSKEFNTENTVNETFIIEQGNSFQTSFMRRTDTVDYVRNDLFSAIRLPYGKGNYSMFVFLPEPERQVKDLTGQLTEENWKSWMDAFRNTPTVDIMLPRFRFPYEIRLNDVLGEMGMGIAFDSRADFRGINRDGKLNIDYVKHKSFIEVNEEGTEASAVTIVAIERTSAGPEKTYFHVNRPFMFAITEKSTGAILFMGTVKQPAY